MGVTTSQTGKAFELILIKPSHYDDEGYVIQWAKAGIPSNSLATLYGVALDCAQRRVLGDHIDLRISAYDESNTRIKIKKIIAKVERAEQRALVCLVGVQTNQFPRAVDIARSLRAAGVQVCIGGFHVSGSVAMLPDLLPDIRQAMDLGISLFAGEIEGRFAQLLRDAASHELQPLYNFMQDLPPLEGAPVPFLPVELVSRTGGTRTSFDAGRGCPFLCSFCTIINVQGRKSRSRTADDVEQIVRANAAQGVWNFLITDDNLARNQHWEAIFDRLIELREKQGFKIYLVAQVDTMAHKIPRFIEKASRAGVNRVFIGLENINPGALKDAGKGQNRITEYRTMLQAWHRVGTLTFAGYILGFPEDTPATIERDIGIIQRELPIDLLEFFILTPLPGSADHKKLYLEGVEMDPDMNNYDTTHVTTAHAKMTKEELKAIYEKAWKLYYSLEHVERVIRRAKVWGYDPRNMMEKLFAFYAPVTIENVHPLDGGIFRRKYRRDRRSGMAMESPFTFYPRYGSELLRKAGRFIRARWQYRRLLARVLSDPTPYSDVAMTPVGDGELTTLEMFTATPAAKSAADWAIRRKADLAAPGALDRPRNPSRSEEKQTGAFQLR